MFGAEFWVAVSFAGFVALVLYLRVPRMVAEMLDQRAADIAKELEDARKLREEAQALLASYQRRQREAEQEAEEILVLAREEATRLAEETRAALQDQLARRTVQAQDKIARAEEQAVNEVRTAAAEIAVAAARRIITEQLDDAQAATLIDQSIDALKTTLN